MQTGRCISRQCAAVNSYCKPTKMNSKIVLVLGVFAMVVVSGRAGLIAARTVEVLQGPSSRTTIIGPDGSSISSSAPGGTVVTDGQVVGPIGTAVLAAAGPEIVVGGGSVGSIVTSHTLAGPAIVPAVAASVALAPAAVAGPALAIATHGGEGEYIHDNTEQLYDDGSYKGE